jgi:hypothetical protein
MYLVYQNYDNGRMTISNHQARQLARLPPCPSAFPLLKGLIISKRAGDSKRQAGRITVRIIQEVTGYLSFTYTPTQHLSLLSNDGKSGQGRHGSYSCRGEGRLCR